MTSAIRSYSLIVGLAVASLVVACAAHGARDTTRVAALTVGESAIGISQAESDLYAAGLYGKDVHDAVGAQVLKVLYAARGFERAAAEWGEQESTPEALESARAATIAALNDLERVLPQSAQARDPLLRAIAVVRAALTPQALRVSSTTIATAGPTMPATIEQWMALIMLLSSMVRTGRTTWGNILAAVRKEGATDEELAALDVRLTDEIERREREQA